jgi:hypothetical protein
VVETATEVRYRLMPRMRAPGERPRVKPNLCRLQALSNGDLVANILNTVV